MNGLFLHFMGELMLAAFIVARIIPLLLAPFIGVLLLLLLRRVLAWLLFVRIEVRRLILVTHLTFLSCFCVEW
ncbi:MAG: hypothetical protein E2598_03820 [Sphingobium sp.]|nr:hypothetical protein [Sphingobium sp.]